jgi:hypothetical protein
LERQSLIALIGVDLAPLYPDSLRPAFITELRKYYIATFRDQFFIAPPAWFDLYIWMEFLYHVPLSIWAIGALLRGMRGDATFCRTYGISHDFEQTIRKCPFISSFTPFRRRLPRQHVSRNTSHGAITATQKRSSSGNSTSRTLRWVSLSFC